MSFRKSEKKIKFIKLPDNHDGVDVDPPKGINTLYWWMKGDDQNGWWVKADLYGTNGDNIECLTDQTFLSLRMRLKKDYGFDI